LVKFYEVHERHFSTLAMFPTRERISVSVPGPYKSPGKMRSPIWMGWLFALNGATVLKNRDQSAIQIELNSAETREVNAVSMLRFQRCHSLIKLDRGRRLTAFRSSAQRHSSAETNHPHQWELRIFPGAFVRPGHASGIRHGLGNHRQRRKNDAQDLVKFHQRGSSRTTPRWSYRVIHAHAK